LKINAEFGLCLRLALDKQVEYAFELMDRLSSEIDGDLVGEITNADQSTERGLQEQRDRVKVLEKKLKKAEAEDLLSLIDM